MNTQLDERQELLRKVEKLSPADIQKVRVFIAGVEAGKSVTVSSRKPYIRQMGGEIRRGHHLGALNRGSERRNRFGFLRFPPLQYLVNPLTT